MAIEIKPPFQKFYDLDGNPLDGGYLYIGVQGQNPEAYPTNVYWDSTLTTPAANPVRTIGGYPSQNGAPGRIYTAEPCSITIKNQNGSIIYPSLIFNGDEQNSMTIGTIADLRGTKYMGQQIVRVMGYYTAADNIGTRDYYWDAASVEADNGGTIIQVTGVTTGRWKMKYSGAVNVKWFGAKGDGVTDDTDTIQSAIDDSAIDALYVPSGRYPLSPTLGTDCLMLRDNLMICGDGESSEFFTTYGSTGDGANLMVGYEKTNIFIRNIKLTNSGFGLTIPALGSFNMMGCGIAIGGCSYVTINNCVFADCGGVEQGVAAIYISSCNNCTASYNICLRGQNAINEDAWYSQGVGKSGFLSVGNAIIGNKCVNNRGFGIVSDCGSDDRCALIDGNSIKDPYYSAISLAAAPFSNIVNNYMERTGSETYSPLDYAAIRIKATSNNNIINNIINGAFQLGIELVGNTGDVSHVTLSCNSIRNITKTAIYYSQSDALTGIRAISISSNIIDNPGYHGIYLFLGNQTADPSGDISIVDNIIKRTTSGASYDAVQFTGAFTLVSCKSNKIAGGFRYGINAQSSGSSIHNNTIQLTENHGIYIQSDNISIVGNSLYEIGTVSPTVKSFIYIANARANILLTGNTFSASSVRQACVLCSAAIDGLLVVGNVDMSASPSVLFFSTYANINTENNSWNAGRHERTTVPASGTWAVGDLVWNSAPTAGGFIGWVCTAAGTPGTWKTFGAISA